MTTKFLQLIRFNSLYHHYGGTIHKSYLHRTQIVQLKLTLRNYTATNLSDYSDEDKIKILNAINKSNNELNKYGISQNRIKKIELWKSRNGTFQKIEQIFEIDEFNIKSFNKFCKSILNNDTKTETEIGEQNLNNKLKKNIKRFNLCIPSITDHIRFKCKECLSVHIVSSNITWTKFYINYEKNFIEIIDWNNINLINDNKKLHINDLIKKCLEFDYKIPLADCYILDNPQMIQASQLPGNTEQIRTNVQKSQLIALLSYLLMKRNLSSIIDTSSVDNDNDAAGNEESSRIEYVEENPNVFYLKRFLASRLFNTFVGNETVSSEQAILNLMRTHYNKEDIIHEDDEESIKTRINSNQIDNKVKLNNVVFPMELRKLYDTAEGYKKEFLGQSLLLGLAFIRLCLLQCPKSLKMIGIKV